MKREYSIKIDHSEPGRGWIFPTNHELKDSVNGHVIEKSPDVLIVGEHKVLVDSEDYLFLSRFNWSIKRDKNTFYAKTNVKIGGKTTSVSMHRLICALVTSEIDHIDRNGLNNRKGNLRFCTSAENQRNRVRKNSHGYRGVYKPKNSSKYACQISINGKKFHERGFDTAEQAEIERTQS